MQHRTHVFGLALVGLFLISGCGLSPAGRTAIALDTSAPLETASQMPTAPSTGGIGQGIQVHGWWTISVLNPDGSQAQHAEFENALVAGSGDLLLAEILGAQATVGAWDLKVVDGRNSRGITLSTVDSSLTATANGGQLVLEGSAVDLVDEPVGCGCGLNEVQTFIGTCQSLQVPTLSNCAINNRSFTIAHFPNVDVIKGQQVHVTVTFSFS
jgi:hypothetical protein